MAIDFFGDEQEKKVEPQTVKPLFIPKFDPDLEEEELKKPQDIAPQAPAVIFLVEDKNKKRREAGGKKAAVARVDNNNPAPSPNFLSLTKENQTYEAYFKDVYGTDNIDELIAKRNQLAAKNELGRHTHLQKYLTEQITDNQGNTYANRKDFADKQRQAKADFEAAMAANKQKSVDSIKSFNAEDPKIMSSVIQSHERLGVKVAVKTDLYGRIDPNNVQLRAGRIITNSRTTTSGELLPVRRVTGRSGLHGELGYTDFKYGFQYYVPYPEPTEDAAKFQADYWRNLNIGVLGMSEDKHVDVMAAMRIAGEDTDIIDLASSKTLAGASVNGTVMEIYASDKAVVSTHEIADSETGGILGRFTSNGSVERMSVAYNIAQDRSRDELFNKVIENYSQLDIANKTAGIYNFFRTVSDEMANADWMDAQLTELYKNSQIRGTDFAVELSEWLGSWGLGSVTKADILGRLGLNSGEMALARNANGGSLRDLDLLAGMFVHEHEGRKANLREIYMSQSNSDNAFFAKTSTDVDKAINMVVSVLRNRGKNVSVEWPEGDTNKRITIIVDGKPHVIGGPALSTGNPYASNWAVLFGLNPDELTNEEKATLKNGMGSASIWQDAYLARRIKAVDTPYWIPSRAEVADFVWSYVLTLGAGGTVKLGLSAAKAALKSQKIIESGIKLSALAKRAVPVLEAPITGMITSGAAMGGTNYLIGMKSLGYNATEAQENLVVANSIISGLAPTSSPIIRGLFNTGPRTAAMTTAALSSGSGVALPLAMDRSSFYKRDPETGNVELDDNGNPRIDTNLVFKLAGMTIPGLSIDVIETAGIPKNQMRTNVLISGYETEGGRKMIYYYDKKGILQSKEVTNNKTLREAFEAEAAKHRQSKGTEEQISLPIWTKISEKEFNQKKADHNSNFKNRMWLFTFGKYGNELDDFNNSVLAVARISADGKLTNNTEEVRKELSKFDELPQNDREFHALELIDDASDPDGIPFFITSLQQAAPHHAMALYALQKSANRGDIKIAPDGKVVITEQGQVRLKFLRESKADFDTKVSDRERQYSDTNPDNAAFYAAEDPDMPAEGPDRDAYMTDRRRNPMAPKSMIEEAKEKHTGEGDSDFSKYFNTGDSEVLISPARLADMRSAEREAVMDAVALGTLVYDRETGHVTNRPVTRFVDGVLYDFGVAGHRRAKQFDLGNLEVTAENTTVTLPDGTQRVLPSGRSAEGYFYDPQTKRILVRFAKGAPEANTAARTEKIKFDKNKNLVTLDPEDFGEATGFMLPQSIIDEIARLSKDRPEGSVKIQLRQVGVDENGNATGRFDIVAGTGKKAVKISHDNVALETSTYKPSTVEEARALLAGQLGRRPTTAEVNQYIETIIKDADKIKNQGSDEEGVVRVSLTDSESKFIQETRKKELQDFIDKTNTEADQYYQTEEGQREFTGEALLTPRIETSSDGTKTFVNDQLVPKPVDEAAAVPVKAIEAPTNPEERNGNAVRRMVEKNLDETPETDQEPVEGQPKPKLARQRPEKLDENTPFVDLEFPDFTDRTLPNRFRAKFSDGRMAGIYQYDEDTGMWVQTNGKIKFTETQIRELSQDGKLEIGVLKSADQYETKSRSARSILTKVVGEDEAADIESRGLTEQDHVNNRDALETGASRGVFKFDEGTEIDFGGGEWKTNAPVKIIPTSRTNVFAVNHKLMDVIMSMGGIEGEPIARGVITRFNKALDEIDGIAAPSMEAFAISLASVYDKINNLNTDSVITYEDRVLDSIRKSVTDDEWDYIGLTIEQMGNKSIDEMVKIATTDPDYYNTIKTAKNKANSLDSMAIVRISPERPYDFLKTTAFHEITHKEAYERTGDNLYGTLVDSGVLESSDWSRLRSLVATSNSYANLAGGDDFSQAQLANEVLAHGVDVNSLSELGLFRGLQFMDEAEAMTSFREDMEMFTRIYANLVAEIEKNTTDTTAGAIERFADPVLIRYMGKLYEDKQSIKSGTAGTGREIDEGGGQGGVSTPVSPETRTLHSRRVKDSGQFQETDRWSGSGRKRVTATRLTPDDSVFSLTNIGGAETTKRTRVGADPTFNFIVKRPDGRYPVEPALRGYKGVSHGIEGEFNLIDLSVDKDAQQAYFNLSFKDFQKWAEDRGYDGFFSGGEDWADSFRYRVAMFGSDRVKNKITEAKVTASGFVPENIVYSRRSLDNKVLMPDVEIDNLNAHTSRKGIYRFSNSTYVDFDVDGYKWQADSAPEFVRDNVEESTFYVNDRMFKILVDFTGPLDKAGRQDAFIRNTDGFQSESAQTVARYIANRMAQAEIVKDMPDGPSLRGMGDLKRLYRMYENDWDRLKNFVESMGDGIKFEDLAVPMTDRFRQALADERKPIIVERHSPTRPYTMITSTKYHEGTHGLITKAFGPNLVTTLNRLNGRSPLSTDDFNYVFSRMLSGNSAYGDILRNQPNPLYGAVQEIVAHATKMEDLKEIGIDLADNAQVDAFLRSYVDILSAMSDAVGSATAENIAGYMDPRLVRRVEKLYGKENPSKLLFGRSRLAALEGEGARGPAGKAEGEAPKISPEDAKETYKRAERLTRMLPVQGRGATNYDLLLINGVSVENSGAPKHVREALMGMETIKDLHTTTDQFAGDFIKRWTENEARYLAEAERLSKPETEWSDWSKATYIEKAWGPDKGKTVVTVYKGVADAAQSERIRILDGDDAYFVSRGYEPVAKTYDSLAEAKTALKNHQRQMELARARMARESIDWVEQGVEIVRHYAADRYSSIETNETKGSNFVEWQLMQGENRMVPRGYDFDEEGRFRDAKQINVLHSRRSTDTFADDEGFATKTLFILNGVDPRNPDKTINVPPKQKAADWKKFLLNKGVTEDEMFWMDFNRLLDTNPSRVFTLDELRKEAVNRRIQIKSVFYGADKKFKQLRGEAELEVNRLRQEFNEAYAKTLKGGPLNVALDESWLQKLGIDYTQEDIRNYQEMERLRTELKLAEGGAAAIRNAGRPMFNDGRYSLAGPRSESVEAILTFPVLAEGKTSGVNWTKDDLESNLRVEWRKVRDGREGYVVVMDGSVNPLTGKPSDVSRQLTWTYAKTEGEAIGAWKNQQYSQFLNQVHFTDIKNNAIWYRGDARTINKKRTFTLQELQSDPFQKFASRPEFDTKQYQMEMNRLMLEAEEVALQMEIALKEQNLTFDRSDEYTSFQQKLSSQAEMWQRNFPNTSMEQMFEPEMFRKWFSKEDLIATSETIDYRDTALTDRYAKAADIIEQDPKGYYDKYLKGSKLQEYKDLNNRLMDQYKILQSKIKMFRETQKGTIPDMPFRKNWVEVGLKASLRYAAEMGYDQFAWTTAKQQVDRYQNPLKDNVDEIYVERVDTSAESSAQQAFKDAELAEQNAWDELQNFMSGPAAPTKLTSHKDLIFFYDMFVKDGIPATFDQFEIRMSDRMGNLNQSRLKAIYNNSNLIMELGPEVTRLADTWYDLSKATDEAERKAYEYYDRAEMEENLRLMNLDLASYLENIAGLEADITRITSGEAGLVDTEEVGYFARKLADYKVKARKVREEIAIAEKELAAADSGNTIKIITKKDGQERLNINLPLEGTGFYAGQQVSLEGLLGTQMAKQIRESSEQSFTMSGEFNIGGEFFKTLYDKEIPKFLTNYLGKRFGVAPTKSKYVVVPAKTHKVIVSESNMGVPNQDGMTLFDVRRALQEGQKVYGILIKRERAFESMLPTNRRELGTFKQEFTSMSDRDILDLYDTITGEMENVKENYEGKDMLEPKTFNEIFSFMKDFGWDFPAVFEDPKAFMAYAKDVKENPRTKDVRVQIKSVEELDAAINDYDEFTFRTPEQTDEIWTIPITSEMKKSILNVQPLYSRRSLDPYAIPRREMELLEGFLSKPEIENLLMGKAYYTHPLDISTKSVQMIAERGQFSLISAETSDMSPEQRVQATSEASALLTSLGYYAVPVKGRWTDSDGIVHEDTSFLVYYDTPETADVIQHIGNNIWGQSAVIHGNGGKYHLEFSDGTIKSGNDITFGGDIGDKDGSVVELPSGGKLSFNIDIQNQVDPNGPSKNLRRGKDLFEVKTKYDWRTFLTKTQVAEKIRQGLLVYPDGERVHQYPVHTSQGKIVGYAEIETEEGPNQGRKYVVYTDPEFFEYNEKKRQYFEETGIYANTIKPRGQMGGKSTRLYISQDRYEAVVAMTMMQDAIKRLHPHIDFPIPPTPPIKPVKSVLKKDYDRALAEYEVEMAEYRELDANYQRERYAIYKNFAFATLDNYLATAPPTEWMTGDMAKFKEFTREYLPDMQGPVADVALWLGLSATSASANLDGNTMLSWDIMQQVIMAAQTGKFEMPIFQTNIENGEITGFRYKEKGPRMQLGKGSRNLQHINAMRRGYIPFRSTAEGAYLAEKHGYEPITAKELFGDSKNEYVYKDKALRDTLYIKSDILTKMIEDYGEPMGVFNYLITPDMTGKRMLNAGEIMGDKIGLFFLDLAGMINFPTIDVHMFRDVMITTQEAMIVKPVEKVLKSGDKIQYIDMTHKDKLGGEAQQQAKGDLIRAYIQGISKEWNLQNPDRPLDPVQVQTILWVTMRKAYMSLAANDLSSSETYYDAALRIEQQTEAHNMRRTPENLDGLRKMGAAVIKPPRVRALTEGTQFSESIGLGDYIRYVNATNKGMYRHGAIIASRRSKPDENHQNLIDISEPLLAEGDADAWVNIATRAVTAGKLADSEIKAIRTLAEQKDVDGLRKYVLGLNKMHPLELMSNMGRLMLLLGVKTVAKNFAGNTLRQFMDEVSRVPASVLDVGFIAINKALGGTNFDRSTTSILTDPVGSLRAYKQALTKGTVTGTKEFMDTLKGNTDLVVFEHPSLFRERTTGWRFLRPLEIIDKYGWRFQGGIDRPFNTSAFHRTLSELQTMRMAIEHKAGNKITYDEAENYLTVADYQLAEEYALMATYQKDNALASKYYELIDGLPPTWRAVISNILKFVKTPLNVVDYTLDYSGIWQIAKLAHKEYNTPDWVDWKSSVKRVLDNPQDRKVLSMAVSQGAIGTMMLHIGFRMAEAGLISQFFDREERKESEQMEAKGTSFGKVNIGGYSVDLSFMTPNIFYLVSGATLYQTAKDWETKKADLQEKLDNARIEQNEAKIKEVEQEIAKHEKESPTEQIMSRIFKNIALQTPFLRQLDDIKTAYDQNRLVSGLTEKWFSPDVLVPAIVKEIAQTKDQFARVVTDESMLSRMTEKVQQNIPTLPKISDIGTSLRETGVPVIRGVGKLLEGREALPVKYDMFGRPMEAAVGIDPTKATSLTSDILANEMDRLNISITKPIGGTSVDVNKLRKEKGELYTPYLEMLVASEQYNSVSDKIRKRILENAIRTIGVETKKDSPLNQDEMKYNLQRMADRELFRYQIETNPSQFASATTIKDRETLVLFAGTGLAPKVSLNQIIEDIRSSNDLNRFINDKFQNEFMITDKQTLGEAQVKFEQFQRDPQGVIVKWWASDKKFEESRDRVKNRREQLLKEGKTKEEVEKIIKKEANKRGAQTRLRMKNLTQIEVTNE